MGHLEKALEKRSEESKESTAKWKRDNPTKLPGENIKGKGWKSYSKIRYSSDEFRRGFEQINWNV